MKKERKEPRAPRFLRVSGASEKKEPARAGASAHAGQGAASVRDAGAGVPLWLAWRRRLSRAVPRDAVRRGVRMLAAFAGGFVAAGATALFSVRPFGIALLCAVTDDFPLVAVGCFFGAMARGTDGLLYAAVTVLAAAARLLVNLFARRDAARFAEPLRVRVYIAALAAFAVALYATVKNYRAYDLFGGIFLLVAAPCGTVCFSALLEPAGHAPTVRRLGLILAAATAVLALPGGFAWAFAAAVAATYLFARATGVLWGTAAGLLFGLCANPSLSPAAAAVGAAVGVAQNAPPVLLLLFSVGAGGACATILGGVGALLSSVLPLSVGSLAALLLARTPAANLLFDFTAEAEPVAVADPPLGAEERLAALSESFRSLSEVCYALSDRYRRPDELALRSLCDRVCDRYCARCRRSPLCWNREYAATRDVLGTVVGALAAGKRVTRGSLPTYFSERCPSVDAILREINGGCAALTEQKLRGDKNQVFAMDYEACAALIEAALEAGRREYALDRAVGAEAERRCAALLGGPGAVTVRGVRRKSIRGSGFPVSSTVPPARLGAVLAEAVGTAVSAPVCETDGGTLAFTAHSVRRYAVEIASLCRPKNADEPCGDAVSTFENREDYFYAMLSDGMGSGDGAALASRICSVFLKKMLSAGNSKKTAVEMLNNLVRSGTEEVSATVDLFELDLVTGRASFIKSGAAPSFVRRGSRVFRIQSKTAPIGILRAAGAEQIRFDAEDGDWILLQSDGVTECLEDSGWLTRLLSRSWDADAAAMCRRILDAAEENNPTADDRSVALIKIKKV